MPEIVQKPRQPDKLSPALFQSRTDPVRFGKVRACLSLHLPRDGLVNTVRQMKAPERMLKPRVCSAGVHQMSHGELPDVAETLKRRAIYDRPLCRAQVNETVYGISAFPDGFMLSVIKGHESSSLSPRTSPPAPAAARCSS